jgi:hypothetical protein
MRLAKRTAKIVFMVRTLHQGRCRRSSRFCYWYPAVRSSLRPRLLQTLFGAFRKTGTSRGIPARPSGGRTACGIAWSRGPSFMVCLRLSATPVGAEVPPRLPWSPRNKALSTPLRPLRRAASHRLHPNHPVASALASAACQARVQWRGASVIYGTAIEGA